MNGTSFRGRSCALVQRLLADERFFVEWGLADIGPIGVLVAPEPYLRHATVLPQFSFRMLLIMVATCGIAMAVIARPPHQYVQMSAYCVPVFWGGIFCVLVGAAVELVGDRWLLVGVSTGVVGSLVCVIAVFTGVFYLGTYVGLIWMFS